MADQILIKDEEIVAEAMLWRRPYFFFEGANNP